MGAHQNFVTRHREAKRLQPQESSSLRLPMTNARGAAAPTPRASFPQMVPLPWVMERADRLHRFCKSVERRRAAGVSVRRAVEYFAWFWRDRSYRTAPKIKAKFSRSRLVVLYYLWLRSGRSPGCFVVNYGGRRAPVTAEQLRAFVGALARAGSLADAARIAGFQDGRPERLLGRLPGRLIVRLKRFFKERAKVAAQDQAAILGLGRELRRLRAAPRLRRLALTKFAEGCLKVGVAA